MKVELLHVKVSVVEVVVGAFSTIYVRIVGASITVDVRYSPKIQRLFLNIRSTLTAAFKYQTSGLCGMMDDDESNDFTMSNGTVVTKDRAVEFAESCKWKYLNEIYTRVENYKPV